MIGDVRAQCSAVRIRQVVATFGSHGPRATLPRRRWAAARRRRSGESSASTASGQEPPSTAHTVRALRLREYTNGYPLLGGVTVSCHTYDREVVSSTPGWVQAFQ